MKARSVFILLAAGALACTGQETGGASAEVRSYANTIVTEAVQLESMASMQNLDYRSHQVHLDLLRSAVNGLGQALAGTPEGLVSGSAREVAALLTKAIEILNETRNTMLSASYKETAKKLSDAAERLQADVKAASIRSGRA